MDVDETESVARTSAPRKGIESTAVIPGSFASLTPRNDEERNQKPSRYGCRADAAMISCRVATWRANAPRPDAVADTVVCGFLPTKAFSTAA
jgi:hypothetical protein